MLIAVHNDQLVLAENAKSDMAYYCPGCGQGVILRRGKHKITHYAHKRGNNCGFSEGETLEHLKGKKQIYQWAQKHHWNPQLEVYFPTIAQRPDILLEINGQTVAVEFQCSPLSLERLLARNEGYRQLKIPVWWILGSPYLRNLRNKKIVQFTQIFRKQFVLLFWDVKRAQLVINQKYRRCSYSRLKYDKKIILMEQIEMLKKKQYHFDVYPQSWKSTLGVFYMTKISVKTKLKAVEEYANGNVTLASVRHKYGIAEHDFQIWVGIYARFGKGPLLNPPKVTGDFRLNLVKWKQENLASISETCIHFGYRSPGSVYQWERLYNKQGPQALLRLRRGRKPKNGQTTRQESRQASSAPKTEPNLTKRKLIVKDTTRCLKKIDSLEKASKKELAQVIYDLKAKYLLKDLIDALPISMSTYQYWQNRFEHPDEDEEELKAVIKGLFNYYQAEYGVRRLSTQIRDYYRLIGKKTPNHKRIQRLMHEMGLKCIKYNRRVRKYDSSKGPNGKKAKNKLNRRFMSNRKYQKMVCDITELKAHDGRKVYLEIIKDLATNQLLTWSISQHPNLQFALDPLQQLLKQLPHTGYQLTLHTDQGWHYQHRAWRKLLRQGNIRQSMSHRATCLDNAACETVFSKLKAEIGPDTSYRNQEELSQAINEWIHFYNERRIQTKLGNQTPLQYEQNLVA